MRSMKSSLKIRDKLLIFVYISSSIISERLNISGGSFQNDKFLDINPMLVFGNIGPKQCIKDCMLHYGCNAVNYDNKRLNCELLAFTSPNYTLLDWKGHYFTEINELVQDENSCWPNPCRGKTKCEADFNNQYICVTYNYSYINPTEGLVISSTLYPGYYPHNNRRAWSFETQYGRRIVIHFYAFSTQSCHDVLKIYTSSDKSSPIRLCGTYIPGDILSDDNALHIEFSSDHSVRYYGFSINLYTIKA
ncbi:bone morphogenetic protein 1-like isoform X2 [Mytilus californianus]|uniref:bone morphogenetic protein 1-like isoform X2 n=1 Tax=Mytilus californianus TaxID=6549 RepID=UPI002245ABA5|nr:bone morphogenetic protein 1-like isoform X2 [Mytilus californianus]